MIKIITGYSNPGGSTVALKNLCKEFNNRNIECHMYGPHDWHLQFGKEFKPLNQLSLLNEDRIICHFLDLGVPVKNCIFSCHEMWWFDFKSTSKFYDKVQFLTQKQADYHNTVKDYILIPNVKEKIIINRDDSILNVAGVIGAVEKRKNTSESIKRAIQDGCDKVLLFGPILDQSYFQRTVLPLLSDKVIHMGYEKNKEMIYSKIDRVYHMSNGEVASLVKDECYTTGTLFFGNENTDNEVSPLTNDEIINLWKKELNVN